MDSPQNLIGSAVAGETANLTVKFFDKYNNSLHNVTNFNGTVRSDSFTLNVSDCLTHVAQVTSSSSSSLAEVNNNTGNIVYTFIFTNASKTQIQFSNSVSS